jgi:hypothetical protein
VFDADAAEEYLRMLDGSWLKKEIQPSLAVDCHAAMLGWIWLVDFITKTYTTG